MPGRRLIDPALWNEARQLLRDEPDLGESAAVAWLYLLTGPHSNLLGLYRLPLEYIAVDLAWSPERASHVLAVLEARSLVVYDPQTQLVWVPGTLRAQRLQNQNQVQAALRAVDALPDTPLFAALFDSIRAELSDKPFLKPLAERLDKRLQSQGKGGAYPGPVPVPEPIPVPEPLSEPLEQPTPAENRHRLAEMARQLAEEKTLR